MTPREARRAEMGWRPVGPLRRFVMHLSVVNRVTVLLVLAGALPGAATLLLLESPYARHAQDVLALCLALGLAFVRPISRLIGNLLIGWDLTDINAFCLRLKEGETRHRFLLPIEDRDEGELVRLRRNLNWMAHHLSRRECRLLEQLEDTEDERRLYEALSGRDELTGLCNRRRFEAVLAERIGRAGRTGEAFHLLLVDLDKFKRVNDTLGHAAGDEVLRGVARALRDSVRADADCACRLGGDEFAVILGIEDGTEAREAADRIRARFARDTNHGCTLSQGLARFNPEDAPKEAPEIDPESDDDPMPPSLAVLLDRADKALYEAKRAGGDRVR